MPSDVLSQGASQGLADDLCGDVSAHALPVQIEIGVPLPGRRERDPSTHKPGPAGPRRGATVAIRELASAEIGASVFVREGTYAFDHEAIRTAAQRAGGSGWYACRAVEGGWRIWKTGHVAR